MNVTRTSTPHVVKQEIITLWRERARRRRRPKSARPRRPVHEKKGILDAILFPVHNDNEVGLTAGGRFYPQTPTVNSTLHARTTRRRVAPSTLHIRKPLCGYKYTHAHTTL